MELRCESHSDTPISIERLAASPIPAWRFAREEPAGSGPVPARSAAWPPAVPPREAGERGARLEGPSLVSAAGRGRSQEGSDPAGQSLEHAVQPFVRAGADALGFD